MNDESVVDLVAGTHRVIVEKLRPFVDDKEAFKRAQKAILEGGNQLKKVPQIFDLVEDFKYDNELVFIRSLTTVYIGSILIGQYEWQASEFYKKLAVGSMVADILLFEDDLEKLAEWERGELDTTLLSNELLEQSAKAARLLDKFKLPSGKPFFSPEVVTIVAQHNERGDGTGIPNKIKHNSITLFSSIYLVSRYFSFLLTESSFDHDCLFDIIVKLQGRFTTGHLKAVAGSLCRILK